MPKVSSGSMKEVHTTKKERWARNYKSENTEYSPAAEIFRQILQQEGCAVGQKYGTHTTLMVRSLMLPRIKAPSGGRTF